MMKIVEEFLMNHQLMRQVNEEQTILHILHVQSVILSMIEDMQYLIDHPEMLLKKIEESKVKIINFLPKFSCSFSASNLVNV